MPNLTLPPLHTMLDWLQTQPYGRIVGTKFAITGCAVQRWLRTRYPGAQVVVDEEHIVLDLADGTHHSLPTPAVYREVLWQIDYFGGTERTIRVEEAAMVLRDVLREYQDTA